MNECLRKLQKGDELGNESRGRIIGERAEEEEEEEEASKSEIFFAFLETRKSLLRANNDRLLESRVFKTGRCWTRNRNYGAETRTRGFGEFSVRRLGKYFFGPDLALPIDGVVRNFACFCSTGKRNFF